MLIAISWIDLITSVCKTVAVELLWELAPSFARLLTSSYNLWSLLTFGSLNIIFSGTIPFALNSLTSSQTPSSLLL